MLELAFSACLSGAAAPYCEDRAMLFADMPPPRARRQIKDLRKYLVRY